MKKTDPILKKGTTLIETIIALSIFGLVLVGFWQLLLHSKMLTTATRERYKAVVLARNHIEKARNTLFEQIPLLGETNIVINEFGEDDPNGAYRRTTTISNIAPNLVEVIITIDLKSRTGLTFSRYGERLQTYIADYPDE